MGNTRNFKILVFRVRPNKPLTRITQEHPDFFDIDLAASPTDDKANQELIKFVSKNFSVKKSDIEFLSGRTSKLKRLKLFID